MRDLLKIFLIKFLTENAYIYTSEELVVQLWIENRFSLRLGRSDTLKIEESLVLLSKVVPEVGNYLQSAFREHTLDWCYTERL